MNLFKINLHCIIHLLLFCTIAAQAQAPVEHPDLFLQTRLEERSTTWLIEKTRILLNNTHINDHLESEISLEEMPTFNLDEINHDPDFIRYQKAVASIFKIDLKKASLRIRIPKIYYKIDKIAADPLNLSVNDPMLDLKLKAALSGLTIKLNQGIAIDFMISDQETHSLSSYFTATVDSVLFKIPDTIEPLTFDVAFQTIRNQAFQLKLQDSNFDSVSDYVSKNQKNLILLTGNDSIPFSAESIKINPVIVKINQMSKTVSFDPFKPLIQNQFPKITTKILTLLARSVKNTLGKKILTRVFSSSIKSDLSIVNQSIYTHFTTKSFSQAQDHQLSLGVHGDLCTAEHYQQYHEQCIQNEPTITDVRSISDEDREKAQDEVTGNLARGTADIAVSVSEEFINRLLKTTINGSLWDKMLETDHLKLGEKGAFIIFNEKTQSPALYLDLLFLGDKGIPRILVNEDHPLHFPLRISTALSFTLKEGIPYFNIITEKVLSDADEIIHGIPEYDMESRTIIGLRKKIAKRVLSMAEKIEGKTALQMEVPTFKNVGLEKTFYEVSPFGRINLYFKL